MLGVLLAAEQYLAARDMDAARLSVEWMLAEVLGTDRLQVYLAHDRPLTEGELGRLREMVTRRGHGEPLAYILGHWEFFGHELHITKDVLMPRPETEQLVELASELAPADGLLVDLGTGSGCIAVAVALARPDLRVVATDVSGAALAVARQNVGRHGLTDRVRLLRCGFTELPSDVGPIDCLVSNPPYVDPERTDLYDPELSAFEPRVALFTEPGDPASSYRQILAGMRGRLQTGGSLVLETGVGTETAALEMLQAADWLTDVELRTDLAGLPRYLLARAV